MTRHLVIALTITALFIGCSDSASPAVDEPPAAESAPAPVSPPALPVAIATTAQQQRAIQVAGRLAPRTRLNHEVPIAGLVQAVRVVPGQRVDVGAELFTVERTEVGQTFRPVAVTARIAGVVSDVRVQTAQQVRANDVAVTLVGLDGYALEAQISDRYAFTARIGQRVTGETSDGRRATGELVRRSQEPDYQTGLFALTFHFPVQAGLSIGTFLVIELPTETISGIFVPRNAIERRYGRSYIWVAEPNADPNAETSTEEAVLRRREVEVGAAFEDLVQVTAGLFADEAYLREPSGREREGQQIRVVTEGPGESAPPSARGAGSTGGARGADARRPGG